MPIHIIVARTPEQIDAVFKIRYRVFVEEEGLLPENPEKRLMDRFDAMPTTQNLIVLDDQRIIGSLRMTLDSAIGLPADDYYDFKSTLPTEAKLLHCGMLCIDNQFRNPRITSDLLLMASYFAKSNQVSHTVAPINPKIVKLVKRIGFEQVGEPFLEPSLNAPMIPLILKTETLKDFFLNFIKKNELQDFLGDYERSFYAKDETIIQAGEPGRYAYLMVSGTAKACINSSGEQVGELSEGELFGELALLTDEVRSLNIIATSEVVVMRLSKSIFMQYFYNNPEQAQKLLKLMGRRTQKLIQQLEALKLQHQSEAKKD